MNFKRDFHLLLVFFSNSEIIPLSVVDGLCNTGLLSGSCVLMNVSLCCSLIERDLCIFNGYSRICGCDGGLRLLNHRANLALLHLVRSCLLLCDLHALDCGFDIRHFLHLHLLLS